MKIFILTMIILAGGCHEFDFTNVKTLQNPLPVHPCLPSADLNPLPHGSALSLAYGSAVLGNHHSAWPRVSATNKLITFYSFATNLVNPPSSNQQAYYFDRATETVKNVATTESGVLSNGTSLMPEANCTGTHIAFISRGTNLTSDVVSGTYQQLFLKNLGTGAVKLVSLNVTGTPGDAASGFDGFFPHVSYDGRYVSFASNATNLVTPATSGTQIFRKDMQTGDVKLISSNANGDVAAGGMVHFDMSYDGRFFVMGITSPNFPDANGFKQLYLKDAETNTLTVLSKFANTIGDSNSTQPVFSVNSEYVFFFSSATNLTNPASSHGAVGSSHFRLKLSDGSIEQIGVGTTSCCNRAASASFDGNIFAWLTNQAQGSIPGGTSVVVAKNLGTGVVNLVASHASGVRLNNRAEIFSLAADGKYVIYQGNGTNIYPGDPSNWAWQMYVGETGF